MSKVAKFRTVLPIAMVLASSPALANLDRHDVDGLFVLSAEFCPVMIASDDPFATIEAFAEQEQLTELETGLLLNYCKAYGEGFEQGIKSTATR